MCSRAPGRLDAEQRVLQHQQENRFGALTD